MREPALRHCRVVSDVAQTCRHLGRDRAVMCSELCRLRAPEKQGQDDDQMAYGVDRKGEARPTLAIRIPAMAGPIARLILIPMELRAIAGFSISRGISCGDSLPSRHHKAAPRAHSQGEQNKKQRRHPLLPDKHGQEQQNGCERQMIAISIRRLSSRSASAPAKRAKRNTGRSRCGLNQVTTAGLEFEVVIGA